LSLLCFAATVVSVVVAVVVVVVVVKLNGTPSARGEEEEGADARIDAGGGDRSSTSRSDRRRARENVFSFFSHLFPSPPIPPGH